MLTFWRFVTEFICLKLHDNTQFYKEISIYNNKIFCIFAFIYLLALITCHGYYPPRFIASYHIISHVGSKIVDFMLDSKWGMGKAKKSTVEFTDRESTYALLDK